MCSYENPRYATRIILNFVELFENVRALMLGVYFGFIIPDARVVSITY